MNTRTRMDMGLRRLAEKYPFHAGVLSGLCLREDPGVRTMAVSITKADENDEERAKVNLLYAPDFVMRCTLPELVGVLLHETHHILFHHLFMKAVDFPDRRALVISQEVTVNEFIHEPLPDGGGIQLKNYPQLKPHTSTEERYKKLVKTLPPAPAMIVVLGGKGQGGMPVTIDNHDVWVVEVDEETAKELIEDIINQAAQKAGGAPEDLQKILADLGVGIGTMPGSANEVIGAGQGKISWQSQLRTYTGSILEKRPVYNRPNRRFPDLVGIVPGTTRRPSKPNILACMDTSGSMTTELVELINGELHKLSKVYTVTVAEVDCEIHKVYPYKKITEVCGRGGTDFRPPLEKEFLKKHKTDLVIYFTDGMGPAPDAAPKTPIIWCLTPGGQVPAAYGKVIWMS